VTFGPDEAFKAHGTNVDELEEAAEFVVNLVFGDGRRTAFGHGGIGRAGKADAVGAGSGDSP